MDSTTLPSSTPDLPPSHRQPQQQAPAVQNFWRRPGLWLGLVAFAGAVYFTSADSQSADSPRVTDSRKRVAVAQVTTASDSSELRFAGVTRAKNRARLSFSLGGRLVERGVDVGDHVRRGTVVARLNDQEIQNAVAGARGALAELSARRAQAERDVERAERLLDAKAATAEEVEKMKAGLAAVRAGEEAAGAQLRETKRLIGEAKLKAPFDGTVTEVFFESGEVAAPGQPVVALAGDGAVELEVQVPESVVPRIHVGDHVEIEMASSAQQLAGTVRLIARSAAGRGSLFPVVVELEEARGLVVGATAQVLLRLDSSNALALPVEAVVNPGGRRPAVFRVLETGSGVSVEKVYVEVGSLLDGQVIVRGPLAVGDTVVVGGQRGLLDGESVEIVR